VAEAKVLVGCPITSYKEQVIDQYLEGYNALSFKNKDLLLFDNSPDEKMFNRISKIKGITVEKSRHTKNVREMITRDRNELRKRTLEGGYDYFFSLEQDVIPPVNAIEKLISNRKRVCNGLYFNFFSSRNMGENAIELVATFSTWLDPEMRELRLTRMLKFEDVFPSRLIEIYSGGIGATLIEKEVLEKIKFRYDEKVESFEDVFFYQDCYEKGIEVWLDSSIVANHLLSKWPDEVKEGLWKNV